MSFGVNSPQDDHDIEWATAVDEYRREAEMLHAENALKLTQILDLEITLYQVRIWEMEDGSPCWCVSYENSNTHSPICAKARKSTEHLWKHGPV